MNANTRVTEHAKNGPDQEDLHGQMLRVYRAGYAAGRDFERAEAEARVIVAEATADYWYFIARNPAEQYRIVKAAFTDREIFESRAEHQRQQEQWDAQERELIERAKAMIWGGADDIAIAVELGLFLPLVANLRSGVVT